MFNQHNIYIQALLKIETLFESNDFPTLATVTKARFASGNAIEGIVAIGQAAARSSTQNPLSLQERQKMLADVMRR